MTRTLKEIYDEIARDAQEEAEREDKAWREQEERLNNQIYPDWFLRERKEETEGLFAGFGYGDELGYLQPF